jgi:enoyl-CoA hydratase/carnithine racemase
MSQRLPYRVGELKAREMTYTAEMIDGIEAEQIGLVNKTFPLDNLDEGVNDLAQRILKNSRDAIAAHKQLYNKSKLDQMETGLKREEGPIPAISDTMDRISGFAK